jgi:hypothetical protein
MPEAIKITLDVIEPTQIVVKAFPVYEGPGDGGEVDVIVNAEPYATETAPVEVSIPVTNMNDEEVGIVTPGVGVKIRNAAVAVRKSNGELIENKAVVAEGEAEVLLENSEIIVRNSAMETVDGVSLRATENAILNAPDGTVVIKDSAGATLKSKVVKSNGMAEEKISDATVNIRRSDNTLIEVKTVKAEGVENAVVGDSTVAIKDSGGVTLHTKTVKAQSTEEQVVSDSVLTLNSGAFLNVKAQAGQNIQLLSSIDDSPIVPASVVGAVIKVAPGGGGGDLTLIDARGNTIGTFTKAVGNQTYDLRTLTPANFRDIYLSRLATPPTGAQLTAFQTFFEDLMDEEIFAKAYGLYPIIGADANDHAVNMRYPYNQRASYYLEYTGSPTHSATGISTNGTTQNVRIGISARILPSSNLQMSVYKRNSDASGLANPAFGSDNQPKAFGAYIRFTDNRNYMMVEGNAYASTAPIVTADTVGLFSVRRSGASQSNLFRNGVSILSSTEAKMHSDHQELCIGASMSRVAGSIIQWERAMNFSYCYVGEALSDVQEANHYTIVQALQLALSRNV